MAARLNPRHSELVLKRIQTSQLVNRLQNNALGKIEPELSDSAIRSAIFLIERTLAKAQAPQDLTVHGGLTLLDRDPTTRPSGYQRRGKAST
jgi:hypothetical protein